MAVTATPYGVLLTDLGAAVHDFDSDTDKVALLTSSYTPNLDTHEDFADVNSFEVSGGGYTAGGVTLAGKTWSYNSTDNQATLDADPVDWTDLDVTAHYAVVYRSTGTAGTSKLIGLLDFGEDRVYAVEPFQLSFPSGVVRITAV